MGRQGSATNRIDADPDVVFAAITDIARLPEWNAVMSRVVEIPDELVPGAEWMVELALLGSTVRSRARVLEIDPVARRFSHRSVSDDGNPSYTLWTWQVDDEGRGARVSVSWDQNPKTFARKLVVSRIRSRMLRNEVAASLDALAKATATAGNA